MNIEELHILLEETGVSNIHYCLCGGLPDEKLCIEEKENKQWQVYYSERGHRQNPHIFDTESEACDYMLSRLMRYAAKRRNEENYNG